MAWRLLGDKPLSEPYMRRSELNDCGICVSSFDAVNHMKLWFNMHEKQFVVFF